MGDFNGLVKANVEDLQKAVDNWQKSWQEVRDKYCDLLTRAKTDTTTYKSWFRTETITKYEYIKANIGLLEKYWLISQGIKNLYPDELTTLEWDIYYNEGYFDDIEAMIKVNPNEVYVSAIQATKVVKWRDLTGDGLVLALVQRVEELEDRLYAYSDE